MIHTFVWWLVFFASTFAAGVISTTAGLFDRSGNTSHRINRLWGRAIMWASGCTVEITGLENLLTDRGQILAANHQSGFDIFSITAFLPVQFRWLSKESLLRIPFMGWAMKAAGYIGIDRENARKAIVSLKQAIATVQTGTSLAIFPEGTRTMTGQLQEFKSGALYLAFKGQLPITPVTIIGTFNIMRKKSFILHPQHIRIIIDKPIMYDEIKDQPEEEVLSRVRNVISRNLENNKPTVE